MFGTSLVFPLSGHPHIYMLVSLHIPGHCLIEAVSTLALGNTQQLLDGHEESVTPVNLTEGGGYTPAQLLLSFASLFLMFPKETLEQGQVFLTIVPFPEPCLSRSTASSRGGVSPCTPSHKTSVNNSPSPHPHLRLPVGAVGAEARQGQSYPTEPRTMPVVSTVSK